MKSPLEERFTKGLWVGGWLCSNCHDLRVDASDTSVQVRYPAKLQYLLTGWLTCVGRSLTTPLAYVLVGKKSG